MRSILVYGCEARSERATDGGTLRQYCSHRILHDKRRDRVQTPPELHAGQFVQKGLRLVGHVSTTFPDSEPPIVHNGEIDDAVGAIGGACSTGPG